MSESMKTKRIALALAFLLASALFAQSATCAGMAPPNPAWATAWQHVAFVAILLGFLFIAIVYMVGYAFNMQNFIAAAKRDIWYMVFISILVGALYGVTNIMDNSFLPAFSTTSFINPSATRATAVFCNNYYPVGPLTSWGNLTQPTSLQQHTIDYAVCLRDKNVEYFTTILKLNFLLGLVSSINLLIYPLGLLGIGFSPGTALKPMVDSMGYALYALAASIAQLKIQEVVLCFSKLYMFTIILPLGVALSALSVTRSAGGALIALAIGFYIVLPVMYLMSEEIVQDYCGAHNQCDIGSLTLGRMLMGNSRDVAQAMFAGNGGQAAQFVNLFELNGPFGQVIYIAAIASGFLPMFSLLITVMFIRAFSRFFGAEVDFSAMIKLL